MLYLKKCCVGTVISSYVNFLFNYSCIVFSMTKLREEVELADAARKKKEHEDGPKAAYGYGGKFGVQADRYVNNSVQL